LGVHTDAFKIGEDASPFVVIADSPDEACPKPPMGEGVNGVGGYPPGASKLSSTTLSPSVTNCETR